MRPNVGHIQYLNCVPFYYGLINNKLLFNMELIKGTPTELNQMILNGYLDVSPISAIEYCRHADNLLLLPDLTVSSNGEVKSILLISKKPIQELEGKKVALTTSSATSRVLTHIILIEKYNLEVEYIDTKSTFEETMQEAEAVLLIGDDALKVLYYPEEFFLYDLGKEWKELTGEKMVYAVWAANKKFSDNKPELLQEIFSALISSIEYSSSRLYEIASKSERWELFDREFLYNYFKSLSFEFGEDYKRGLKLFYKYAQKYKLVKDIPELEFAPVKNTINKNNDLEDLLLQTSYLLTSPLFPENVATLVNRGAKDIKNFLQILTPPGLFK